MGNAGGNGGDAAVPCECRLFRSEVPLVPRVPRPQLPFSISARLSVLLGRLKMYRPPAALAALTAFLSPFARHLHGIDLPYSAGSTGLKSVSSRFGNASTFPLR
jgi:hypothetical protein